MPFRCANGRYSHNEEPSLDEILAEPIVRLLMARDGVDEAEIRRLVQELKCGVAPELARSSLSVSKGWKIYNRLNWTENPAT
jgi:hypothetical protein